jgi:hypothetical protein
MTIDGWVKGITVFTVVLLAVTFPLIAAAVGQPGVPFAITVFTRIALSVVALVLVVSALGAPKAVKLTHHALVVERLGLGDYEVPWAAIGEVREAPPLQLRGPVRRVAGNGGFFGFTGLFSVQGVGTVRCWATRLNTPTVLVERHGERPVLLGVDEPQKLLAAITARAHRTRSNRTSG